MERCAVCNCSDARALTTTRLVSGEAVTVCGTHAIMHQRVGFAAESRGELRSMLRERRETTRRLPIPDELGARLIEAFSTETERRGVERRAR